MYRPLAELLEDCIACAEVQLDAAKRLDTARLSKATELRQDLLFQIATEGRERLEQELDDEVSDLADELRELDRRLSRVLESGITVMRRVNPTTAGSTVYDSDGRYRDSGS